MLSQGEPRDAAVNFDTNVTTASLPPYSWCVPVGPDRPCWGQPEHKLISREIILEVLQPMRSLSTNVTHG